MVNGNFQLGAGLCWIVCCVIILKICLSSALTEEDLTVEAGDLGTIIGTAQLSIGPDIIEHIRFAGMPYANHRRFLPSELRTGSLNETGGPFLAKTFGASCWQADLSLPSPQAEECLTVNVWTRKVNKGGAELRPVILFVHGGGFSKLNGELFPGSRIINRDVVFVNFHYRLGVLGFFCLNNEEAPGNAGMYDVVTALKWVQKYIHHFGGDPNKVTLAGQSAGGVAVTLMMISPLAKGLFHSVIAASGSILTGWGNTNDSRTGSLSIAKACGCYENEDDSMTDVVNCMKNVEPVTLVQKLNEYQISERLRFEGRLGVDVVSPTIQYFDIGDFPKLLEDAPAKLFAEGKQANVSLVIGCTRHDGSYVAGVTYKTFVEPNDVTSNTEFMKNEMVRWILDGLGIGDGYYGIYEAVAKLYIGDARLTGDFNLMLPGLIDIHNVYYYKAPGYRTALLHSKLNRNTYFYSFDYNGTYSLWSFQFGFDPPYFPGGITHSNDLLYLFPLGPAYNDQEKMMSNRLLDYWANFAEFGNPTPLESNLTVWPTLETNENQFFSIDVDSKVMNNYPDKWVDASLEIFPHLIPSTTAFPTIPTSTTPITTTAGVDRIVLLPICRVIVILATISLML